VGSILRDLTDRRGLRNEWYAIDSPIQQEIILEWVRLIAEAFGQTPVPRAKLDHAIPKHGRPIPYRVTDLRGSTIEPAPTDPNRPRAKR
jgi:hypothetical protein